MSWHDDAYALATVVAGPQVAGDEGFGPYTLRVPASYWRETITALRDGMGCTYFDWLSAVDELADGFRLACHLARIGRTSFASGAVDHLMVTTMLPREDPQVASIVPVFAGAGWHERETHEMFGIEFRGGVQLDPLLLPDAFEGHPLRKEFVLASRVAKAWPGAKDPGESDADQAKKPGRRRQRPPGVPEPDEWGPREPGSAAPDPLAHAQPAAGKRPRRTRKQSDAASEEPSDG